MNYYHYLFILSLTYAVITKYQYKQSYHHQFGRWDTVYESVTPQPVFLNNNFTFSSEAGITVDAH